MKLPLNMIARLQSGRSVAAELPALPLGTRAYLVILPQAPNPYKHPTHWFNAGAGEPYLRDANDITGYELRYLQHLDKYTDEHWGWDYDAVLADPTTRVKRTFVNTIYDVEQALEPWHKTPLAFDHPHTFDSSLVNSSIEGYLNAVDR